jgi:hypothetical protein
MKTFLEFLDDPRNSSVSPLPRLAKLPKSAKLPKMPRMNGGGDNRVNSGPTTQRMAPLQAVPQLQQMIVQLSMLIRRLSQG